MRASSFVLLVFAAPACVGGDDTNIVPDGGRDTSTSPDGSQPCSSNGPTCSDASTLQSCTGGMLTKTTCAFGCVSMGTPHCAVFQPDPPVTPADLTTMGVTDVVVSAAGFIDTGSGAIDNVRPANMSPTTAETHNGIVFQARAGVGVFIVQNFTLGDGITLKARGPNALAIVATQKATLKGTLDARGYDMTGLLCGNGTPGPGGAAGGGQTSGMGANGSGMGPGLGTGIYTTTAGAGGGAYGGHGGAGGGYPMSGGNPVMLVMPIVGGSGGGGSSEAYGGGGGGGVQIVSPIEIDIGGGANPGGINAGGCGGHGGAYGATGGGGGAGGIILLEAPVVSVLPQGGLAANGGAGSTGDSAADGSPGLLSNAYAGAPAGVGGYGNAGAGAYGADYDGVPGMAGTSQPGGSGGGSVGRIRVENQSGTLTVPTGAFTSPTLSTSTGSPATVGTIVTM
jgi:hypothetical protein